MNRREFLALGAAVPLLRPGAFVPQTTGEAAADITLRISEIDWEIAPGRTVRTLAYNDRVPGPLLRVRRGRPITVEVVNGAKEEDIVHWHGLRIPSDVDGAIEEGTPPVPRGGSRRYTFTPEPTGTRWYHSHISAGRNLKKGTYSGQFGMMIVQADDDPGAYDQEIPILLHEFDPRFARDGPLDVEYRTFTVNGRMLGAGEPVRVRPGARVLFRIVNASATLHHRLALPRHTFQVVALDGNAVATPRDVTAIAVGPGERVDALVDMNSPGVWAFGEVDQAQRAGGLGIVVEYAGTQGPPRWEPPSAGPWDYTIFGGGTAREPDGKLTLVFRAQSDGYHWTINGKSHPRAEHIVVQPGKRYRWLFDNQSAHDHPVHLHRHTFEVVRVVDQPTAGIFKDVVVVPAWRQVEVDVTADHPGPTLFHCHQQWHMDMGFMTMMHYAGAATAGAI